MVRKFLSWLGGHETAVLVAVALIAAGIWAFAFVADEVIEGGSAKFDTTILLSMRRGADYHPFGPPAFQEGARDITALGGVIVLTLVTGITAAYLTLDGKGRLSAFVIASVASGLIASVVLKAVFHRPRPNIVPHAVYVDTASFPSGHSMMSAVTYLTLGALIARSHQKRRMRAFFLLVAVGLTFLIGVSRVYLGVHWPTDVLAGWTAGAVWALLCWVVARRLQRTETIEPRDKQPAQTASI